MVSEMKIRPKSGSEISDCQYTLAPLISISTQGFPSFPPKMTGRQDEPGRKQRQNGRRQTDRAGLDNRKQE